MFVPQKSQYALRALFELGKNWKPANSELLKIGDIAKAQSVPLRFLEVLLNTLKKGGFVVSFRGKNGGYRLSKSPSKITVAEVLTFMQGPIVPVDCMDKSKAQSCEFKGDCVFLPMWKKATEAIFEVYNGTTIQTFVDLDFKKKREKIIDYSI